MEESLVRNSLKGTLYVPIILRTVPFKVPLHISAIYIRNIEAENSSEKPQFGQNPYFEEKFLFFFYKKYILNAIHAVHSHDFSIRFRNE